jgi:hypothetical protein
MICYGPNNVVATSEKGFAMLYVENDAVHSLESRGDPACLLAVMRRAEAFCRSGRLLCVVEFSNPLRRKLRKVYKKFGFNPVGTAMVMEMNKEQR